MLRIAKLLSVVLVLLAAWVAGLRADLSDEKRHAILLVRVSFALAQHSERRATAVAFMQAALCAKEPTS